MTHVFLERRFAPPIGLPDVRAMMLRGAECLALHKVEWRGSFLATDGGRMLCWFEGPDAESARIALRRAEADVRVLWAGTAHDAPEPVEPNVLVERTFTAPVTLAAIQAIEDAGAWCLETHRVKFARTFFSRDGKRMLCLYRAPDAEAVRVAQREAGMPVAAVWPFRPIRREDLAPA